MSLTRHISFAHAFVLIAFSVATLYSGNPVLTAGIFILLLVSSVLQVWPKLAGEPFGWSSVHWLLLFYLLWHGILIFLSIAPEITLRNFGIWFSFVVVSISVASCGISEWRRIFIFFMIAGVLTAIWGITEHFITGIRANGPIVDPNAWAALNNLFFFMLLSIYLAVPRYRIISLLGLAIFAAAVFTSSSRAGLLVLVCGLAFISSVSWRHRTYRTSWIILLSLLLAVFLFINSEISVSQSGNPDISISPSYPEIHIDPTADDWSQRFSMWRAALSIAQENLLAGIGPGNFSLQYPLYREVLDLSTTGSFAHNDYLQFLAEGGPLLLLFLLLFTGYLLRHLVASSIAVYQGRLDQTESLVLVVAMGGVLVHALLNFPLYLIQIQMLMGLAFGRLLALQIKIDKRRLVFQSTHFVKAGIALLTILVTFIVSLDSIRLDVNYKSILPFSNLIRSNPAVYYEFSYWQKRLRGSISSNHFVMAEIYRSVLSDKAKSPAINQEEYQALLQITCAEYESGLAIFPYNEFVRVRYAELLLDNQVILSSLNINSMPESLFLDGIRLNPTSIRIYLPYVGYLESTGREDEAYRILTEDVMVWMMKNTTRNTELYRDSIVMIVQRTQTRGDTNNMQKLTSAVGAEAVDYALWFLEEL